MTSGEPAGDGAGSSIETPREQDPRIDAAAFAERVRLRLGDDAGGVEVRHGHVWVTHLRGSGVAYDIRRAEPYMSYDRFDFDIPVGQRGDAFDRFWVLIQEMRESARIIEQAIEGMPSGSHIGAVPKRLTLPPGEVYVRSENPLGELGFHLISTGGVTPYRLKARTPSFSNIQVVPHMLRGAFVPDMIAVLGSMFFVVGDIDR